MNKRFLQKYWAYALALVLGTNGVGKSQGFVLNNGATINVTASTNLRVVNSVVTNKASGSITNNGIIYLDSTFQQNTSATYTGGAASWLWFEGTSNQNIMADATPSIARLKVDNPVGITLTQNVNISNALMLAQGVLNLNSYNIDLGTTGVLVEARASNSTILDNTFGLSQSNKGGYVRASSRSTNGTLTEIAGLGIHLANAGTVSIDRYHYQNLNAGNGSIKKIYEVSGTPSNAQMRIEFGMNELGTMSNTSALQLYHFNGSTWDKHTSTWNNASAPYVDGSSINSFSPWTVGEEPPLPIELLNFGGYRKNIELVTLHWQTASEINNKGFEVEMSEDNRQFRPVAYMEGAGNSRKTLSYQTNIPQPHAAYFRLKQIDQDGKFNYSHSVFVGESNKTFSASVFPNPSNGYVTVICKNFGESTGQYQVTNAVGQIVANGTLDKEVQLLEFNSLPSGMYFIKIYEGDNVIQQKIQIHK